MPDRAESKSALWQVDSDLFGPPNSNTRRDDSWSHSPEFDSRYRQRRAHRRKCLERPAPSLETVVDPEDVSSEARRRADAYGRYFSGRGEKRRGGDPRLALPECSDLPALAGTFGASPKRLAQAERMGERGLRWKAKRLVLCGRIGHRVNCSESPEHRFLQPYMCRARYCETCGPAWFRQQFSELSAVLEPVIEHLSDEARKRGRGFVVAKLDFTIPNTGAMPASETIRQFHCQMHFFWRQAERAFRIKRKEYGHAGCDEFGGSNTNLHRHSLYVGPVLPQRRKELSALWSIAGLCGERRREMLRFIRKHGLRHTWHELAPWERRFVSIKRARSFRAALAHALKYPAKFLSVSTPERLAELEVAFHHTRRFSTGGAFYSIAREREPGEDSPVGWCPICGARLCEVVEPWVSMFDLESEGRRDVDRVRREAGRTRVLSGSGPP
jgi:hypothetical protein